MGYIIFMLEACHWDTIHHINMLAPCPADGYTVMVTCREIWQTMWHGIQSAIEICTILWSRLSVLNNITPFFSSFWVINCVNLYSCPPCIIWSSIFWLYPWQNWLAVTFEDFTFSCTSHKYHVGQFCLVIWPLLPNILCLNVKIYITVLPIMSFINISLVLISIILTSVFSSFGIITFIFIISASYLLA